jgi:hypothetical protein
LTLSPRQHKFYRGVFLYSFCKAIGVDEQDYEKASRKIHNAFKEYLGIKSFKNLSEQEFKDVLIELSVYLAETYGFVAPESDEEGYDANKATLHDLLKFKKLIK